MEITILCDQKDCIHNAAHKVHHDHSNDKCTRSNKPIIIEQFIRLGGSWQDCNSKERDMTDPSKQITTQDLKDIDEAREQKKDVPFGCLSCKSTGDDEADKDYCMNICPVKKE
jgi:hypothetical protein